MWMNHAVAVLSTILGLVFLPISFVTMNLLGCLIGCTGQFAVLMIPAAIAFALSFIWPGIRDESLIALGLGLFFWLTLPILSIVWLPFFGITLGLSYLYRAAPWLGLPIGLLGVPVAVVGTIYCALLPSMGCFEDNWLKMSICESFPYSADFLEYYSFVKSRAPEGRVFSLDFIDLDYELAWGAITRDQYARWSRIRSLTAFRWHPGPLRADV